MCVLADRNFMLYVDGVSFHGMEEVDGSNPSRSTTTFQTLTAFLPPKNVVAGVQTGVQAPIDVWAAMGTVSI